MPFVYYIFTYFECHKMDKIYENPCTNGFHLLMVLSLNWLATLIDSIYKTLMTFIRYYLIGYLAKLLN